MSATGRLPSTAALTDFVGAHYARQVARQLKMLAAQDDKTIQELLENGVTRKADPRAGRASSPDLSRLRQVRAQAVKRAACR
jgi:hypothetical protein